MPDSDDLGMTTDLSGASGEDGPSIAGVVTDFDNVPLVGVRVEAVMSGGAELDLLPVLTDGGGRFSVGGLAQGRYDLRFVLGRVKARTLAVPVGTDQLRVRLARPQGILLVTRTQTGAEPPDIVWFVLERDTPIKRVREHYGRTLKRRLLLWSIRPGTYTLTAWGGPYLPVKAHGIQVQEKEAAPEVEIVFGALGGTVDGQVVGPDGAAVKSLISWRRTDSVGHAPRHLTTQETDPVGRFLVRGLPTGKYLFTAYDPASDCLGDASLEVEDQGLFLLFARHIRQVI